MRFFRFIAAQLAEGGFEMHQLTIRGVDTQLHSTLKENATELGLSLNKYVLALLEQAVGKTKSAEPKIHTDLDWFFGSASAETADDIDRALQFTRQIDPEMWE